MRNHIPNFFYTRSAPSLTKRAVHQSLTLHKWNLAFWPKKIRPSKTIPPARISAPLPKQLSLSSTRGSLQPRLSRLFHHSVSDFFEHDHHPASSSSSFHHHGAQHSSIILSLTPPKTRNCPFGREKKCSEPSGQALTLFTHFLSIKIDQKGF